MPTLSPLTPGSAQEWAPSIQCRCPLPGPGTSRVPLSQPLLPNYLPALGASHFATSVPLQPLVPPRTATALTPFMDTKMSLLKVAQRERGASGWGVHGDMGGHCPLCSAPHGGNRGSCCLSAVHVSACKYRDFYINLIKGLYKQSWSTEGLEVERNAASGHQLSFTTVLGLASLRARSLLSPSVAHSVASLRYSSCGGCPGPARARRRAVMTSVPVSVRVQLTDSGSVSSGSWHLWVKVSQTVPSSATCREAAPVQWNAMWHGGYTAHSQLPQCF